MAGVDLTGYVPSSISLKRLETFLGDHIVAKRSLGTTIVTNNVYVSVNHVHIIPSR